MTTTPQEPGIPDDPGPDIPDPQSPGQPVEPVPHPPDDPDPNAPERKGDDPAMGTPEDEENEQYRDEAEAAREAAEQGAALRGFIH